ncbi:MAG: cyclic nucleotide-binding domain-containing protein [Rhizobiales bacterium]|nr:cyclic nucleotide-binding domain-containing protein [Hyphomicrobiales bacterium]
MSILDDVSMLRRIPLFAQIDTGKLKLLAFSSERLQYSVGQSLFRQGEEADHAYVVVDGSADVIVETPAGPVTVAMIQRNALVGEIGLLCDVGRTATITAREPLTVLKISKEHFLKLLEESPSTARGVMRELAQRLADTTAELTNARNRLRELGAA